MQFFGSSGRFFVVSYFLVLIIPGSLLLSLPDVWTGPGSLSFLDALFTATSAVCVTGLIVVDTAMFSPVGQAIIMVLIQAGGLGVVLAISLFIWGNEGNPSLYQQRLVGDYFLPGRGLGPARIIRRIFLYTLVFEGVVTLWLWGVFSRDGIENSFFVALFHSVSAFCNAGFSTFSNSLENFVGRPEITGPILALVISGGLGFVVIADIKARLTGQARHLHLHSRLMISGTLLLLAGGTVVLLLTEENGALAGVEPGLTRWWEALVMATMPRTAGFDTVAPAALSAPGELLTILLMFIGAGPASTAGGLKVSTFVILVAAILQGVTGREPLAFSRRRLDNGVLAQASVLFLRMVFLLFVLCTALIILEPDLVRTDGGMVALVFEVVSAFSTVGLSQGITGMLGAAGKVLIIVAMFAGRLGVLLLVIPRKRSVETRAYSLPDEEILLG